MSVRGMVNCSVCGKELSRVLWNYGKNRAISEFFCDNVCKGAWQRIQREKLGFTKEWLTDQYINKKKSADDIAIEIGRDPKRVWEWIRNYGIPTRPRGAKSGHSFKKGDVSPFTGRCHTEETKQKFREIAICDGRVPFDPAIGSYMKGRKGADTTNWKGGITPERESHVSSEEWKEVAKAVWARDRATCQICGKDHNKSRVKGGFHIHHIVSFQNVELRSEITNLILFCKECHRWVHSKKNKEKLFIKGI